MKFNGRCSLTKDIEANSLLYAKNGVFFVGDWLGLKPASMTYLQNGNTTTSASPRVFVLSLTKVNISFYFGLHCIQYSTAVVCRSTHH